jgi:hypothetical protein
MENPIHNIAVISFPRTASKSLSRYYSNLMGKPIALGVLHKSETRWIGKNDYDILKVVTECNHILHGHWHTLHLVDEDVKEFIRENYKIVTCYRDIDKVKASIVEITDRDDLFDETMKQTLNERPNWDIWKHHILDGDNIATIQEAPKGFC